MLCYIDPGTGSMLFTILIGVVSAGVYALRGLAVKVRFALGAGKSSEVASERQPLVIFAEDKRYWNVFGPVCRELERRGVAAAYYTCSEDDPCFAQGFCHVEPMFIGTGNKAFARLNILRADVLLATTPGLDVYQWKRCADVGCYVHIGHAPSDLICYRIYGIDYFDAILLSGQFQEGQVRRLEALRELPAKELALVGLPYLDEMRARLQGAQGAEDTRELGDGSELVAGSERVVLLAPSWGQSAILSRYGESIIDALLATGYRVIIRPHPQSYVSEAPLMDRLKTAYPDSAMLHWDGESDNFASLSAADILISDFSGVIFDFALVFDKPVIYADTSFDDAPYDVHWLDEGLWTFDVLPKIGHPLSADDLPDLKGVIDECIDCTAFQEARDEARAQAWAYPGEGAARVVDWLEAKIAQVQAGASGGDRQ